MSCHQGSCWRIRPSCQTSQRAITGSIRSARRTMPRHVFIRARFSGCCLGRAWTNTCRERSSRLARENARERRWRLSPLLASTSREALFGGTNGCLWDRRRALCQSGILRWLCWREDGAAWRAGPHSRPSTMLRAALSLVEGSLRSEHARRPGGNRASPGAPSRFPPGGPSGTGRSPCLARGVERAVASGGLHHLR